MCYTLLHINICFRTCLLSGQLAGQNLSNIMNNFNTSQYQSNKKANKQLTSCISSAQLVKNCKDCSKSCGTMMQNGMLEFLILKVIILYFHLKHNSLIFLAEPCVGYAIDLLRNVKSDSMQCYVDIQNCQAINNNILLSLYSCPSR
jgi:hypothetical protein